MSEESLLSRREFTLESALAILSAATITISCGGSNNPTTTPTTNSGNKEGSISANHGHTATITSAELTSRNSISLNIQGQATHNHIVELTAAEVTSIGANAQVAKTSTTDNAHNHTVTFN
jgi:hypothetical protein